MQLTDRLDERTRELLADGFDAARARPVTLRANTLKATSDQISTALDAAGIGYARVPWYEDAFVLDGAREREVWDLDIYRDGLVYLQSLSSMLPPLILDPLRGADILDMCSAPGGKTSQIAALTANGAHLTACEMSAPRAEKLAYNLDKLGAQNVNIMRTDARRLDEFFSFDQILLDAPCTGTGTYRTGDERAEKRMTPQLLDKVVKSQRALLDRALTVLKPGGTLVYSTCSVLPEENDEQVRAALKRHRDCKVVPVLAGNVDDGQSDPEERIITIAHADEGEFAWPIMNLPNSLEGTLTLAPTRLYEGFYVAVIQKQAPRTRR